MNVLYFLAVLIAVPVQPLVFSAQDSRALVDTLKHEPLIGRKCRLDGVSAQKQRVLIFYRCGGKTSVKITLFPKKQPDTFHAGAFWVAVNGTKRLTARQKAQIRGFFTKNSSKFNWTRPIVKKKTVSRVPHACKQATAVLARARKLLSKGNTRAGTKMIRGVVKGCNQTGIRLNALSLMGLFSLPGQAELLKKILNQTAGRHKKEPGSFSAGLDYALTLAYAKRVTDAIRVFKEAMKTKPGNISTCPQSMLIQALSTTANADTWKFALSVINGRHPCKQAVISTLWMAHKRKDIAGIKSVLHRGLALYPNDSDIRLQAAYALDVLEDFDDAFDLFMGLAIQNPARPRVLSMLGTVAVDAHDRKALISRLKKLRKNAKNRIPVDYVLGVFAYYDGDFDKVEKLMAPALKVAPDETRPNIYIALVHFWKGDFQTALRMLKRLEPKAFEDPDVYYCEAVIWADRDIHKATQAMKTYVTMMNEEKGRMEFGNKRQRAARILRTLESGKVPDELFEDLWAYRYRKYYRYARFGGIGLVILLAAAWFIWKKKRHKPED